MLSMNTRKSEGIWHPGFSPAPRSPRLYLVAHMAPVVRTTALPSPLPVGAQAKAKGSRGVRQKAPKKAAGRVKKMCIAWQLGKCQRGNSCEFIHGCTFPKSDGSPCLSKDHGAVQHADKSH